MSEAWGEVYKPPVKEGKAPRVPWAHKKWADFTDQEKLMLKAHMRKLSDLEAKNYTAYLTKWCGVPITFLQQ